MKDCIKDKEKGEIGNSSLITWVYDEPLIELEKLLDKQVRFELTRSVC